MSVLYPRLTAGSFLSRLAEVSSAEVSALARAVAAPLEGIGETFGMVGGRRIQRNELVELQRQLRGLAKDHGYPGKGGRRDASNEFDRAAAMLLHESMRINAHEASQHGVWQYLCTSVVPDVVRWRFPGQQEDVTNEERFRGGRRNCLGRLWWRAYVMKDPQQRGEAAYMRLSQLGEDEFVQLMERPSLFGDRRLLRMTVDKLVEFTAADKSIRSGLLRDLQVRMLRKQALIFLPGLDDHQVAALIHQTIGESAKRIAALRAG